MQLENFINNILPRSSDPKYDLKRTIATNVGHLVDPTSGHVSKGSATPLQPRPRGPVDPAAMGDKAGTKNGSTSDGTKDGGTKGGTTSGGTKSGGTKGPNATKRSS